jgi:hypothetical protein
VIGVTTQRLQKLPRLLIWLFCTLLILNIIAIFFAYVTGHASYYGILEKFYFLLENNFPTYFSGVNLLIAAGLLFHIYNEKNIKHTVDNKYWLFLSLVFLFLSIDEIASIHELSIRPMQKLLTMGSISSSWLFFPWVIAGIILVLVLGIFFLRFYLRLPLRYKFLFGVSAALIIGGAIGLEIIDGHYYNGDVTSKGGLIYFLLTTVEESMEMMGEIIFIKALIDYIRSYNLITDVINSSALKMG